jgi:hypothetical protein
MCTIKIKRIATASIATIAKRLVVGNFLLLDFFSSGRLVLEEMTVVDSSSLGGASTILMMGSGRSGISRPDEVS